MQIIWVYIDLKKFFPYFNSPVEDIKITGKVDCLCCYHESCTESPNCMETITPEMVFIAIKELLREIHNV
jgi:ADP-heptose:LPS heptosyltransferase